jgi:hypothetical protein
MPRFRQRFNGRGLAINQGGHCVYLFLRYGYGRACPSIVPLSAFTLPRLFGEVSENAMLKRPGSLELLGLIVQCGVILVFHFTAPPE